jgi:hypothetical protein
MQLLSNKTLYLWAIMDVKAKKSKKEIFLKILTYNIFYRDATILGTTVYNSVYKSKIPTVIIKDIYLRKDLVTFILSFIINN